jgi:hypothetical protein
LKQRACADARCARLGCRPRRRLASPRATWLRILAALASGAIEHGKKAAHIHTPFAAE